MTTKTVPRVQRILNHGNPALADAHAGDVLADLIADANGASTKGTSAALITQLNNAIADIAALRATLLHTQADVSALYVSVMAPNTTPTAKSSAPPSAVTSTAVAAPASGSAGAILTLEQRGQR